MKLALALPLFVVLPLAAEAAPRRDVLRVNKLVEEWNAALAERDAGRAQAASHPGAWEKNVVGNSGSELSVLFLQIAGKRFVAEVAKARWEKVGRGPRAAIFGVQILNKSGKLFDTTHILAVPKGKRYLLLCVGSEDSLPPLLDRYRKKGSLEPPPPSP